VGYLGHGGVGTYPDRPFLKWRFGYEEDGRDSGWRNNPKDYLDGCEKLHVMFSEYADRAGIMHNHVNFDGKMREKVGWIIGLEKDKEGRTNAWKEAIAKKGLFESEENEVKEYSEDDWEKQKNKFASLDGSHNVVKQGVYQFHQAAIYHRDYTLKQLLPRYGIVVL
jgi:hypothetical protein